MPTNLPLPYMHHMPCGLLLEARIFGAYCFENLADCLVHAEDCQLVSLTTEHSEGKSGACRHNQSRINTYTSFQCLWQLKDIVKEQLLAVVWTSESGVCPCLWRGMLLYLSVRRSDLLAIMNVGRFWSIGRYVMKKACPPSSLSSSTIYHVPRQPWMVLAGDPGRRTPFDMFLVGICPTDHRCLPVSV